MPWLWIAAPKQYIPQSEPLVATVRIGLAFSDWKIVPMPEGPPGPPERTENAMVKKNGLHAPHSVLSALRHRQQTTRLLLLQFVCLFSLYTWLPFPFPNAVKFGRLSALMPWSPLKTIEFVRLSGCQVAVFPV
jgi:hypothetical protein